MSDKNIGKRLSHEIIRGLKSVGEPSVSPDASQLTYTLSWIDHDQLSSMSQIIMKDLSDESESQFTQGPNDTNSKFSPSGNYLAFLRPIQTPHMPASSAISEGDRSKIADDPPIYRQLWIIPTVGGEAWQVSQVDGDIFSYTWSPDSTSIAFSARIKEANSTTESRAGTTRITQLDYRHDTLGWKDDWRFHIFSTNVNAKETTKLTHGDFDDTNPVWSPDGSKIAFISSRLENRLLQSGTEAYVIPNSGGEPQLWSGLLGGIGALTWSPEGDRLLAIGSEHPGYMVVWQSWLYVLNFQSDPIKITTDSFRPTVSFPSWGESAELRWQQDGDILLLGDHRGETYLYQVSDRTGTARKLFGGGCQSNSLALDLNSTIAVIGSSSPNVPSYLNYYLLGSEPKLIGKIDQYNQAYLEQHSLGSMERTTIQRDGVELDCRLFLPPDFDPSGKYPLVLDIHGGPNGAFYDSFSACQQLLSSNGYLVLAVNPRGSSTYGNAFMESVIGDWGGQDYLDLMAAVNQFRERSYVDSSRLGVHGYSYGGYMSSWMIGQTNLFKAAVVGAPCTDLFGMYGTSDIGITFGEAQWSSNPTNPGNETLHAFAQKLLSKSPITFAPYVQTPVLLLHGESDFRCPISQSESYFTILKRLGKTVELVRFPNCSHLFLRYGHPTLREEYLRKTIEWFKQYL